MLLVDICRLMVFVVIQGLPGKNGAPGDAGTQGLPVSMTFDTKTSPIHQKFAFLISDVDV